MMNRSSGYHQQQQSYHSNSTNTNNSVFLPATDNHRPPSLIHPDHTSSSNRKKPSSSSSSAIRSIGNNRSSNSSSSKGREIGTTFHTTRKRGSRDKMMSALDDDDDDHIDHHDRDDDHDRHALSREATTVVNSSSSGQRLSPHKSTTNSNGRGRSGKGGRPESGGYDEEDDNDNGDDEEEEEENLSDTTSLLRPTVDTKKGENGKGSTSNRSSNKKKTNNGVFDRLRSSIPSAMDMRGGLRGNHIVEGGGGSSGSGSGSGSGGSTTSTGNRSRSTSFNAANLAFTHSPRTIYTSSRPRIFGITNPLTMRWFFSIIGSEYCHIYFWIIKDLAWVQNWRRFSIIAGVMALVWSIVILYHSLRTLNWHEIWNFIASFLWLFANFWWMLGEAHDYEYPESPPISIQHTYSSSKVLEVALMWCLIYYLIILPFRLLPCNRAALEEYDDGSLKPRFPCFDSFRQYENLHMMFWIAKDLAWNRLNLSMWLFCLVPTVLLAVDFIYISATTKCEDSTVDTVHFLGVLLWVIANSIWAYGDFFMQDYSEPMELWSSTDEGFRNARWYSSWALICAMIPIALLYIIWISLTLCGKLKPPSYEEDPDYYNQEGIIDWIPIESETDTLFFGGGGVEGTGNTATPTSGTMMTTNGTSDENTISTTTMAEGVSPVIGHQSIDRTTSASSLLQLLKTNRSRGNLILHSQSKSNAKTKSHSSQVKQRGTSEERNERDELQGRAEEEIEGRVVGRGREQEEVDVEGDGVAIEMIDMTSSSHNNNGNSSSSGRFLSHSHSGSNKVPTLTSKISGNTISGRNRSQSLQHGNGNGNMSNDHSDNTNISNNGGSSSSGGGLLQWIFQPTTLTRSKNSSDALDELAATSTTNNSSSFASHQVSSNATGLILDDDDVVEMLQQTH